MSWQEVLAGERPWSVEQGDCVAFLRSLPEDSVSMVIGSPPYMDARTYGIGAVYDCQEWVDFMLAVTEAAVRACKGLVLWVAAGVQRDNCYWPGCEGLMWEWWKRGNQLWCPAVWWKVDEEEGGTGIPGSGGNVPGKRWLRKDWEYVMAFHKGPIPYDHPEVMGHEPRVEGVGGQISNRTADGRRINQAGASAGLSRGERWRGADSDDPWKTASRGGSNCGGRTKDGRKKCGTNRRQNGKYKKTSSDEPLMPPGPVHDSEGNIVRTVGRPFPKLANPGNVLPLIVKARVGGGHMGSRKCHSNEAPFPEALPEFFIQSYAAPNDVVCDPFSGSGTTLAMCVRWRRRFVGCDLRESQVELSRERASLETPMMFVE